MINKNKETDLKQKQTRYVLRVHGKTILKGFSLLSYGLLTIS